MKEKIVIVGSGGHAKSCIEAIESQNKYKIIGLIDVPEKVGHDVLGYEVIGDDNDLGFLIKECPNAVIGIGQIKSNELRVKIYNRLKEMGYILPIIKASSAHVSKSAVIGESTVILHGAIINAASKIGVNTILNSKCLIEHDVTIGNHCHISTSSTINGEVRIGNNCFIGSGSTIAQGIYIKDNVIIGMGTRVFKNIDMSGVFYEKIRLNV